MDERKLSVIETFDASAATYGRAGPDFFWPLGRALVEAAGVQAVERVLDVACGTGALAVTARERGAHVVAVDLAPAMVAAVAATGLDARLMDAERLDFEEGAFDCVLCGFAVFFMTDPPAALAEWRRVLRPGGRVALSTFVRADPRWAWRNELLPARVRPPRGRFDDSREGLDRLLRDAGFPYVRFREVDHELRFADVDEWWAWGWSHGFRGSLSRLTEEELVRYRAAAAERIAAMDAPTMTIAARLTTAARP